MRMLPTLVLVLAVAGCGGSADTTPASTTGGDGSVSGTEGAQIALPDASATLVKFTMPGMT